MHELSRRRRSTALIALFAALFVGGSGPAAGAFSPQDGSPTRKGSPKRQVSGVDKTAPTKPSRLRIVSSGASSLTISWRRSSDRGGVAGYTVYRDGVRIGSTAEATTSFTASELSCGKSYLMGVEAYDRAGNRSARASIVAATSPCVDSQPPSAPLDVSQFGVDASSITVAWGAASDDFGVVGYEVLRDGALAGSTASTLFALTSLHCGTMYTVGIRAFDAAGNRSATSSVLIATSECPDTTAPSAPSALTVASVNETSVSVGWQPSSDERGVVGYDVYRGSDRVDTTGATSYIVAGLACGSSYVIGVEAYDGAGNRSGRSAVAASTSPCPEPPPTPPADTTAPSTPTGLTVTGATGSTIALRWNASSDNVGVAGYGLYRDNGAAGSASLTSATFSGLACGRSYQLAIDAYDASGNRSARGAVVASTSPCPDTSPPSIPSGLNQSGVTESTIGLGWSASSDNVGVAGYGIYLAGVRIGSTSSLGYTFASLACGTSYTVGVDAYDAAGSRSALATLVVSTRACPSDTQPPSIPQNQTLGGFTQSSFTMSWSAASDNVGVAGYALYLNGVRVTTTTATSYTYASLQCGSTYTVGLEAFDAAGNASDVRYASGPAATSACTPPSGDTSPPSVPSGVVVGAVSQSSVAVSWSGSSDDVGVAGYGYYRDGSSVGNGTGTSYLFAGLACGTSYAFAVDAYDAAGNRSGRSAPLTASTSACSSPPPASGSASVWVDPNGGSCVRSSAPGPYSDGQACGSLQAAYNVAQANDTVNIVDGTYSGQTLAAGTKALTFRAAGPGRPSFGHFVSAAANITVRGILIEDRSERSGACSTAPWGVLTVCGQYQTYDNVIVDGLNTGDKHGIESPGRGFTLKNSEVRNIRDQKGFEGGADDMLIENNYWHDITIRTDGVHNECMFINGGSRSVYRGNLFIECPVMAMFFTNWNGGPAYRDVVIENNVIGHATNSGGGWHAGPAFYVGGGYNNQNTLNGWIVRYNTFEVDAYVQNLPGSGSQWYGNLGGISCVNAFTYSYNVGQTCGGTGETPVANAVNSRSNPNIAPFYINAPAHDFHLKAGAAAINRADPNRYPPTDKDGNPRTDGHPDAGAYEIGS